MQTSVKSKLYIFIRFRLIIGDNFFYLLLCEKKKKKKLVEKVVQEDLCKLLQKVPASYYLYNFLRLDDHCRFFGSHAKFCLEKPRLYRFPLKVGGRVLLFTQAVLRVDKYDLEFFSVYTVQNCLNRLKYL